MPAFRVSLILLLCCWGTMLFAAAMPSNTLVLNGNGDVARLRAHRARMGQVAGQLTRIRAALVQKKVLSRRAVLPRIDSFIIDGKSTRAAGTRALGDGTLTFTYTNWNTADAAALKAFIDNAYPKLVSIYGKPASSATVTIDNAGELDNVEGGEFILNTATGNITLRIGALPEDFTSGDYSHRGMELLHLVLHAFHAPKLIGFDAWEEGMARAAAVVAILQITPDYDVTYDTGYLLPLYESTNQPALSSPSFFPTGGSPYMSIWRLGMAMSAWMKIYAENGSVFSAFNNAYYSALNGNSTLNSNIAGLKNLLATVVPSVEGQAFAAWYDNQYIMRTDAVVGDRILIHQIPSHYHSALMIYTFNSNANGQETPIAGTANLSYLSYAQKPLYPYEGDQVTIPATGDFAGIGYIDPSFYNIGEVAAQRLRITVVTDRQLTRTIYFPYAVAAHTLDPVYEEIDDINEFFGVLIGADTADLGISIGGQSLHTPVQQGAFGLNLPSGLSYFTQVLFTTTVNGQTVTMRRNIGPWYYMPVLTVGADTTVTLTNTFLSGLALVSFPLTPTATDPATLFGYAPLSADFHFAWWDPALTGADKYRRYPASPGITPGRGYWMQLPATQTAQIVGRILPEDDPHSVSLTPGWNMIGNMYLSSINPWAMTVATPTTSMSLLEAVARGLVGPVWMFNPNGSLYEVPDRLTTWQGGWISNLTGGTLQLEQQAAVRQPTRAQVADAARYLTGDGWTVALKTRAGTSQDAMTLLGINPRAQAGVDGLDWLKPPAFAGGVQTAFIHPQRKEAGAAYATDIRREIGAQGEQWELEVRSSAAELVTLSWPDLTSLPREYQATLEDLVNGKRQFMRTSPAYTYMASGTTAQPDVRRFRVRVERRQALPVSFLHLNVARTRGRGASIQVQLSAAAELQMEVRTAAGKLIRTFTLPPSRTQAPLVITWDGRAAGGKLIPAGAYLLHFTARSDDGFTIRRVEPMLVP